VASEEGVRPTPFRPGSVSYLRIPAGDPAQAAAFYASVFGWRVQITRHGQGFEDGSGHVIGHFVDDCRSPATRA